jgi:tetratricopeptide (TPR) repeat protein
VIKTWGEGGGHQALQKAIRCGPGVHAPSADGRKFLAVIALSVAVTIFLSGPTSADQSDSRLGPLFAALGAADSPESAQLIEAEIWQIWLLSDSDAVNQLMGLGVARLNAGDYSHALALFDRIVTLAPGFAEGWNKRATVLYLLGRYADSIADIDRALALEPRHFGALSGLGMCNARLHRTRAAIEAFQRALVIDPNLPGVERTMDDLRKQLKGESI